MTNPNDTAFPRAGSANWDPKLGLTKRELFALVLLATSPMRGYTGCCKAVVDYADDLIEALNREKNENRIG